MGVMTLTGSQYTITSGDYTAVITEQGAALRSLRRSGIPLILEHDPDQLTPAAAGQLLIPWPNRIDHGEYTFEGTTQKLPITEAALDNAIHGLTRWESWSLLEITESAVTLGHRLLGRPGYPFRLDLTARYSLSATVTPNSAAAEPADPGLTVTITATNRGSTPAPYGHGAHPYLTVGVPVDECTITLPTTHYQPVDPRMIPSGPPLPTTNSPYDLPSPLGPLHLDTAFTTHGSAHAIPATNPTHAEVHLTGGGRTVTLWADPAHPWLQLYTADGLPPALRRTALAVEPMTCPANAFNTGIDLIHLAPGATFEGSWGITAQL